jgi:hypothetical protein
MLATGALTLIFGSKETSDFWIDGLHVWWTSVAASLPHVKRLVIYLDNGPNNSGTRTQFLKRLVQFADWSGLEVHLVYYPPYHSKYNRVERCWSSLQKKWNGSLLTCWEIVADRARRMTWKGAHPTVTRLETTYAEGVKVPKAEMRTYATRLQRSPTLPKYDIIIKPQGANSRVN